MAFDDLPSGLVSDELFKNGLGITYADFTILNTEYSDIGKNISLKTDLGKGIILELPIMASPMDTVTNAEVCIALALEGGIGVIHYNYLDSNGGVDIDAQVREIEKVKRFQNGFIQDPVTLSPDMTIAEAIAIGTRYGMTRNIIDTFPVTANGKPDGLLVGLLRKQDYRRTKDLDLKVSDRMLHREHFIVGKMPLTLEEANNLLWDKHISHLPIIDKDGHLKYLVTQKDIEKNEQFPSATKDKDGRLRVLFAVETRPSIAYERLEKCFAAGADGVVIDTSQGFTQYEKVMIEYIAKKYPDKLLIGGNISTREAAKFLSTQKVDAYRCGQGSGSICTTAGTIGISRSGATGIYESSKALLKTETKTIADGGIRQVGDIVKALALGAHCVMLGNMLAGTEEGPGEVLIDNITGMPVKSYRGMGSKEANDGRRGYSKLPQGVSGRVQYKGSLHKFIPLVRDGLMSAFEAMNCKDLPELHQKLYSGKIRFEKRTVGAARESEVHDLMM